MRNRMECACSTGKGNQRCSWLSHLPPVKFSSISWTHGNKGFFILVIRLRRKGNNWMLRQRPTLTLIMRSIIISWVQINHKLFCAGRIQTTQNGHFQLKSPRTER
ncbi:uncharacterized protein LOC131224745 [Magnolia sinica]|uniref:uncharacterized protein LOC131224745 n=1 Tax=Magnolia sinica TaxID=86752 RepID=UPI002658199F|nr:uncharacterized protein LOC131224745 [Magnolia sinica]